MVEIERINPLLRAAHHEAGHATVGTALGLRCLSAQLQPGYSGGAYLIRTSDLRKEAITTMAGAVAEGRFIGWDAEIWMITGSSSDHARALEEVGRLTGRTDPRQIESSREWEQAWSWAQIYVSRYWSVIVQVAELLIRDREVAGETIRELMHPAGATESTRAAVA